MSVSRGISQHPSKRRRSHSQIGRHAISGKHTKKEAHNTLNNIFTVLFGIIFIAVLCSFIILLVVRNANIARVTKEMILDIDVAMVLENFDDTHYLINQINDLHFHDKIIYYSDVDLFVKTDAVAAEIGDVFERYARALAAGDLDYHITSIDVVNHSKNVEAELHALFGFEMTKDDIEYLADTLDDILDFNSLSISGLAEDFDLDITTPTFIMSTALLWITGLICIVLLTVVILLCKRNLPIAFLNAGILVTLSGLIAFIAGLWFDSSLESLSYSVNRFIIHLEGPANLMSQYGFIFSAIGILITVISFSVSRLPKNRYFTDTSGGTR